MTGKLAATLLNLFGWKVSYTIPRIDRCVVIGAPHTSNWDFPLALLALRVIDLPFHWVGKHTLFKGPLGPLMRFLGGIPVDRRGQTGFTREIITLFQQRSQLALVLAPEGTRSRTDGWKSGFYHIAVGAGVPIALGYIDYRTRQIGIERLFTPSGDIESDFAVLQDYYRDKFGRYPNQQGPVRPTKPTAPGRNP